MKKLFNEFKDFINQGNAMDLAIGVIIGAAFKGIVDSLVNHIIMPIIGVLTGGVDLSSMVLTIGEATISYGLFLNAIINFLTITLVIFLIVKSLSKLKRKKAEEAEEPAIAEEVLLLREIRDSLKKEEK
ncbi:MAG: large conductance mechanosensitive channel protein MscL [Fusobacteria bacterium]|nr:large conductance mechanosensitive channel protein MscL [Fusobacteriota bacterium]